MFRFWDRLRIDTHTDIGLLDDLFNKDKKLDAIQGESGCQKPLVNLDDDSNPAYESG